MNVELHPREGDAGYVINLDGVDVADLVDRLDLAIMPGNLPVLTLRMAPPRALVNAHALVELDEQAAAFLRSLGWTPPDPMPPTPDPEVVGPLNPMWKKRPGSYVDTGDL